MEENVFIGAPHVESAAVRESTPAHCFGEQVVAFSVVSIRMQIHGMNIAQRGSWNHTQSCETKMAAR